MSQGNEEFCEDLASSYDVDDITVTGIGARRHRIAALCSTLFSDPVDGRRLS